MQNQRILVTGGAGFIGSHLVDALVQASNDIIVIDSLISSTTKYIQTYIDNNTIQFIHSDIRDRNTVMGIEKPIDYIFHFAADPDVRESVINPLTSFEHNVKGTLNILELARHNKVKGFVFASSGGTLYGDAKSFPILETSLLKPISPYGASKAAGEMYISAYANVYKFKAVSLRYANIFGERSNHGVSYDFFQKLSKNPRELEILGNGEQKKSYLHVSDCISASLKAADNLSTQIPYYDCYNIGSEQWISVNELARLIEKFMSLESSRVNHRFTGGPKGWEGDVHLMLLSIQKIKDLGWKPKMSFEEGMKKYIRWMQTST